jgi:hypothetical protein
MCVVCVFSIHSEYIVTLTLVVKHNVKRITTGPTVGFARNGGRKMDAVTTTNSHSRNISVFPKNKT